MVRLLWTLKNHEELYDKTNEYFKDKARKECLWERFANSHKLSVCKTWFESQSTWYGKLTRSKSIQAQKEMIERQDWIQDKFYLLKTHIRLKELHKSSGFKSLEPVHLLPQHTQYLQQSMN